MAGRPVLEQRTIDGLAKVNWPTVSLDRLYVGFLRVRPGSRNAYLVAAIIVAVAGVARLLLAPWVVGAQFITFFPAVIIATFICGAAAGSLAVVLSALAAWFAFIAGDFSIQQVNSLGLFIVVAFVGVGIVGAMRGAIAEVRRMTKTLNEANWHLETLVNASPLAIVELDRDGRVSTWNPAAEKLFGWRADEVFGRELPTVPDGLRDELQSVLASGIAGGRREPVETRRRRKDGTLINVSLWTAPRLDRQGLAIGTIGMLADITERKRLEATYLGLIESAPDAMVIADEQGRIMRVNARTEQMFGYSREEMLGRPVEMLLPQRIRDRHVEHRHNYHRRPQVRAMGSGLELYGLRKDGTEFPIDVSLGPILTDEGLFVSSAIRDDTARKEAEQQLRQSQRLQAMGQLTGGVAHEFNNLLMVVLGNAEMLALGLQGSRLKANADLIVKAVDRGNRLTSEMLSFSRRQPLRPQSLDPQESLEHLERLLRPVLDAPYELKVELEPDTWHPTTDATQLENALVNLIINARDAMPSGGRILLRGSNRVIDQNAAKGLEVQPGRFVVFEVTDTGAGMPPDVAARAIEPFFTTKEVGKGTGLGLSMVHGFVKQSAGSMQILSEFGKGTTVRLFLPAAVEAAQVATAVPRAPGAVAGDLTVLLVEDDPDVLMTTADMLRGLGYRVIEATDGPAALAALQAAGHVDVLFTDVIMPNGMSGLDVAREAQSRQPGLKVIYASGYNENVVGSAGVVSEGGAFLRKPYASEDLARVMQSVAPHAATSAA